MTDVLNMTQYPVAAHMKWDKSSALLLCRGLKEFLESCTSRIPGTWKTWITVVWLKDCLFADWDQFVTWQHSLASANWSGMKLSATRNLKTLNWGNAHHQLPSKGTWSWSKVSGVCFQFNVSYAVICINSAWQSSKKLLFLPFHILHMFLLR